MPEGKRIRFEFLALDIEYEKDCAFDWVKITNADADRTAVLNKTCGTDMPTEFLFSTSNVAYVDFHSDNFGKRTGFQLSWAEISVN